MNVIFSIVVILLSVIKWYNVKGESITVCDGSHMTISCEAGQKIVIEEAQYGRFDKHSCPGGGSSGDTACKLDETLPILNKECFGKSSCTFLISTSNLPDPCPGTSKYLIATYNCVEESQIIQVCNTYYIKQQSGYLISPNYPHPYTPKLICLSEIVQQPGYGTKTTILDLEVEARSTKGCYDWLSLMERDNAAVKVDYCGNMNTVQDRELSFTNLNVKFQPDAMNNFRGFLIKFEVVPLDHIRNPNQGIANQRQILDSGEAKIEELKQKLLELEKTHQEKAIKKKQRELEERKRQEEAEHEMKIQKQKREEENRLQFERQKQQEDSKAELLKKSAHAAVELRKQAEQQNQWGRNDVGGLPPEKPAVGCTRETVPIPAHGYLTKLKEGKRAVIQCVDGYNMDDEDNGLLVCHANSWAGSAGTCLPISCGSLDTPDNGEVIYRETTVGSSAEYLCHMNYQLVGEALRKCMTEGHWSGNAPYCKVEGARSLSLLGEVLIAVILTIIVMHLRKRCRGCRLQLQLPIQITPAKAAQL